MKNLNARIVPALLPLLIAVAPLSVVAGSAPDGESQDYAELLSTLSRTDAADTAVARPAVATLPVDPDDPSATDREILLTVLDFARQASEGVDIQADLEDLRRRLTENSEALMAALDQRPVWSPEILPVLDESTADDVTVPVRPAEPVTPEPWSEPAGATEGARLVMDGPSGEAPVTPETIEPEVIAPSAPPATGPDTEAAATGEGVVATATVPTPTPTPTDSDPTDPPTRPGTGDELTWRQIVTVRLDILEQRVRAAEMRLASAEEVGTVK